MKIPAGLLAQARLGEDWARWLDGLPQLADDLLDDWELRLDGDPMHGFCALVLPVRTASGRPAVLKLHSDADAEESDHEHLVLQHWHGNGAVQLLRADPHRRALLLERLHPENLNDLWDLEACSIVAGLYRRIHLPALPALRPLTTYVDRWTTDLGRLPRGAPIPRRLVEQAVALGRDFVDDAQSVGTIIHGDLHYENVLAADREPWLVIDPKPMSGDPHYELAPMLWNRFEELAGDVRAGLRRRFHTLLDDAGLDEDRARDWVVVRMVHNAMWAVQDAMRAGVDLSVEERVWITQCITIAKAVQD
ncbi:aminoglycoside resistance protein [Nocardioides sp. Soil797]|nr:aminoglycoside resistance protein [Nocardioides sp. Soil797]